MEEEKENGSNKHGKVEAVYNMTWGWQAFNLALSMSLITLAIESGREDGGRRGNGGHKHVPCACTNPFQGNELSYTVNMC